MGLKGSWRTIKGVNGEEWQEATFTTDDQREEKGATIQVPAFKFVTGSPDVALIIAGVHGSEQIGVQVAQSLIGRLKDPKKRPALTAVVIPQLFEKDRFSKGNDTRYVAGEKALYRPRQRQKAMNIEPNRNLPRVGEGYADVLKRAARSGIELIDYYDRVFDDTSTFPDAILADMMLAENRILVQLIEQEKPKRTASLHGKWRYNELGDGPGIFVDPRGGFNPLTGLSWTKMGQTDDELARRMVRTALKLVPASVIATLKKAAMNAKPPKKDENEFHPFAGNLLGPKGLVPIDNGTVHYSVASGNARGTSLGMWGSIEQLHQEGTPALRDAMPVVTVEIARFEGALGPGVLVEPMLQSLLNEFLV